ncbi:alpha/beta hydrolase [Chloroflexi bacterium TSY]|nr:alpha/beta hydrolase [Chloroflexi bacterium TSY]
MLLIHGSFATSRWWEDFMLLLPEEIYAVAPDLRGCGLSEQTESGYGIAEQAEDLYAFVSKLNLRGIDLVGHASGGAIVIEFALTYPHLVSSLTLVDSVPIEGIFTPLEALVLLDQMKTDRLLLAKSLALLMPTYVDPSLVEAFYSEQSADLSSHDYANLDRFQEFARDAEAMAPAAFTAIAQALGQWNRFVDAETLSMPCLIVWGELDQIIDRADTTRMLIAIPGANNLEVLRGVGHSPMLEAPLTLVERILDFVTEDFGHFENIRETVSDNDKDCQ